MVGQGSTSCPWKHSTISKCPTISFSQPSLSPESPMAPRSRLGRFAFLSPSGHATTTHRTHRLRRRPHMPAVQRHPRVPSAGQVHGRNPPRLQCPQDARKWRSHHGALRRERRSVLPGASLSGRITGRHGSRKQEASRGHPQEEEDIVRPSPSGYRPLRARACSGGASFHHTGKRARRPPQGGLGGSPLEGRRPRQGHEGGAWSLSHP